MKNQAVAASAPGVLTDTDAPALLVFTVGEQKCSLPITSVVRIIEMVAITPLPNAPAIIQGIINVQGNVVPVIDLHCRFGLGKRQAYGLHTPIILADISGKNRMVGLIVDTVEVVVHVPREKLEITEMFVPPELAGQTVSQTAHLAGVAEIDHQMIPVLNVRTLFSPIEQTKLSQALS